MIFDEEEGGMIFLLSQRQQKGKVLNTCYWRIYNIMTMAMMMILLHKSCSFLFTHDYDLHWYNSQYFFLCNKNKLCSFEFALLIRFLADAPRSSAVEHSWASSSSCVDCSCCIAVEWRGRCSPVSKSVAAFKLNSNLGIERIFKDKDDR